MNRRQRRAEAQSSNQTSLTSASDIPHSRPIPSPKPAKTLLEIAAERQFNLQPHTKPFDPTQSSQIINVKFDSQGNAILPPASSSSSPPPAETPWLDTLFLATSLSALHFTLETLTVHQYAQELKFLPITIHTIFIAFPTLVLLIHLFHGHLLSLPYDQLSETTQATLYSVRQTGFLVAANVAGCELIRLTNAEGYYAVMKNAPSIGTLWVWCILEMGLAGALGGVVGPGIYAWWHGYGVT